MEVKKHNYFLAQILTTIHQNLENLEVIFQLEMHRNHFFSNCLKKKNRIEDSSLIVLSLTKKTKFFES